MFLLEDTGTQRDAKGACTEGRPCGEGARRRPSANQEETSLWPYHPELAGCLISEAKQGQALLVLGWETA